MGRNKTTKSLKIRDNVRVFFLTAILLLSLLSPYGAALSAVGTVSAETCTPAGEYDFCIEETSVDTKEATVGDKVEATATVKNTGDKMGTVKLYVGFRNKGNFKRYPDNTRIHNIPPGETGTAKFTWEIPDYADSGEYEMTVDAYDPSEEHPFDSTGWKPSLTVSEKPRLDERSFSVKLDSEPVSVATTGEGTYEYATSVKISAPERNGEYRFDKWTTSDGTLFSDDSTYEISRINTDFDLTAQYKKAGKPDLEINNIELSEPDPQDGDNVYVEVEVANTGEARASDFKLELVAGSNIQWTEPYDLESGESKTIGIEWTVDTSVSSVTVEADFRDQVDESNEENNRESDELELGEEATGEIEGQVIDEDGDGLSSVTVSLDDRRQTQTSPDGYYEFTDVSSGIHRLEAQSNRGESDSSTVNVVSGDTEDIDLRVVSDKFDLDLDSAPVGADLDGGGTYSRGDDIIVEAPETYQDQVFQHWEASDGEIISRNPVYTVEEIKDDRYLTAQYKEEVTKGSIIGSIVTASDGKAEDATVTLDTGVTVETDSAGSFVADEISAGQHRLEVSQPGYHEVEKTIEVDAGKSTDVGEVVLQPLSSGQIAQITGLPDSYRENTWYDVTVAVQNTGEARQSYSVEVPQKTGVEVQDSNTKRLEVGSGQNGAVEYRIRFHRTNTETEFVAQLQDDSAGELDRYSRLLEPQESEQNGVSVTVTDSSNQPLEDIDTEIVLNNEKRERLTDSKGKVNFNDISDGRYIVRVDLEEGYRGENVQVVDVSDGSGSVDFDVRRVEKTELLSGTVHLKDGTEIEHGTVQLLDSSGDRIRSRAVEYGEFELVNKVTPGEYRLLIDRVEDGTNERVVNTEVMLSGGENFVELTASDPGENKEKRDAVIAGVGMGDWCWADEGSPPSYCGDEVEEYPTAYLTGWTLSGLVVVGDIRDLPSTIKKGNEGDFLLTIFGLAPTVGDAASTTSKLTKFVNKYPNRAGDAADLVKNSRFFRPFRDRALRAIYKQALKNGGTQNADQVVKNLDVDTLTELEEAGLLNKGLDSDALIRLSDKGIEPEVIAKINDNGADLSQTIDATKTADNSVAWLDEGTTEEGWEHILKRHIEGTEKIDVKGGTSIFPTGEVVKGKKLPDRMSKDEVKNLIIDATKRGTPTSQGDKTKYYFKPSENGYQSTGIDEMRVFVYPNGQIETAYPLSGDSVKTWAPELNDGDGGFINTK